MPRLGTPDLSTFESRNDWLNMTPEQHEAYREDIRRAAAEGNWQEWCAEIAKAHILASKYAISDDTIRDALTLVDMQDEMLDNEDLRDSQECAL